MKFSIDVIFLTKDYIVADFVEDSLLAKCMSPKPRVASPTAPSKSRPGTITRTQLQIGDQLVREEKVEKSEAR